MRVDDVRTARLSFTAVDKATPSIRKAAMASAALPSAMASRVLGAVRGKEDPKTKEQSSTHDGESSASERFAVMCVGIHELLGLQLSPGKPTPAKVRLERVGHGDAGRAQSVARGMVRMAVTPLAMMSQPVWSLLTKPRRGAPGGATGAGGDGAREQRGKPTLNIVVTFMPFTGIVVGPGPGLGLTAARTSSGASAAAAAAGASPPKVASFRDAPAAATSHDLAASLPDGALSASRENTSERPVVGVASSRELRALGAAHAAAADAAAAAAASLSHQFMGVLYVRLIRGEDMLARDRNGRSDPYVKLRLGRQKRKSSTRYNTVQPVWEEEFEFIVGEEQLLANQAIQVDVWDRDPFNQKDIMVEIDWDLYPCRLSRTGRSAWMHVYYHYSSRGCGFLNVIVFHNHFLIYSFFIFLG